MWPEPPAAEPCFVLCDGEQENYYTHGESEDLDSSPSSATCSLVTLGESHHLLRLSAFVCKTGPSHLQGACEDHKIESM